MFKISLFLLLVLTAGLFAGDSSINHNLFVKVDPPNHSFTATDTITIPANQKQPTMYFLLHGDLTIESKSPDVIISLEESEINGKDFGMDQEDFEISSTIKQKKYALQLNNSTEGDANIILGISGTIHHPVAQQSEEYAKGFSTSPGIISEEGVYLGGSTYWIPWFNEELITFRMTTSLPETWDVVSQGTRTIHKKNNGRQISQWNSPEKMEEVFLIAAQFTEYSYSVGAVEAMAFLRTPDENLANKYLETTAQYLEMYRKLVGPYPFSKFALIENFWETGYGMASFTLLGEKIIRMPWILHSSYPHELLHNWWGNSVYIDFETGNWCEGLTAYMADHLIKEQRGQGAEYRRSTLQGYTDYVNEGNDFPLSEFLSRHNASTASVGYGKSSMLWNMLRQKVGDENFIKGFQKFYNKNKFKKASYENIRQAFELVTEEDLKSFFDQWVKRTGAPELNLTDINIDHDRKGYNLNFKINQIQEDELYNLEIPVAISFKEDLIVKKVNMSEKSQSFEMTFPENPVYMTIDPQFDLFRRLHHNEIPPSLSKVFGSEKVLILLPSQADQEKIELYKKLAELWSKDQSDKIETLFDFEVTQLPEDKAVWIFGWENTHKNIVDNGIKDYSLIIDDENVTFGKSTYKKDANSFILSARHPQNPNSVVVLLTADNEKGIPGLARKLPHYGKYSYLAFEGTEPTNVAKGQWKAVNSPLASSIPMVDGTTPEKINIDLPKREPLARLEPVFSADRLLEHVHYLAGDEMEGRGIGTTGLDNAADYIAEQFKKAGLKPGGNSETYFQNFTAPDKNGEQKPVKNVIGILPGLKSEWSDESVIVCAHYDHLGFGWPDVRKGNEGKIHNGADDNASGVAVLLELIQTMSKTFKPDRTVIFIAFSAEESGLLGSKYYVVNAGKYPVNKIMGVLNMDTVGRLGKNKLLVLNTNTAREWKYIFMGTSYVTGVDAEMVSQDLDASDQGSFIKAGVPGVQFFSGAHSDYHRPTDTIDKIDAAGLVKVATFVREGILYLAERDKPLSFAGKKKEKKEKPKQGGRRVSTGTMPDFAFSGEGVRIASLSSNSPAQKAGLKKGDIIIQFGKFKVTNLTEYSDALKTFQPGDEVELVYLRKGTEIKTKIKLAEK